MVPRIGPFFARPIDPGRLMALTSYAGCYGTYPVIGYAEPGMDCTIPGQILSQLDGSFNTRKPISFAQVTDGLSQTMFVAEHSVTSIYAARTVSSWPSPDVAWYFSGNLGSTLFLTFFPPNIQRKVNLTGASNFMFSASSNHPGGLNALMGGRLGEICQRFNRHMALQRFDGAAGWNIHELWRLGRLLGEAWDLAGSRDESWWRGRRRILMMG